MAQHNLERKIAAEFELALGDVFIRRDDHFIGGYAIHRTDRHRVTDEWIALEKRGAGH